MKAGQFASSALYTTEEPETGPNLKSVLEQNSMQEFVELAKMSNKKFNADRDAELISTNQVVVSGYVPGREQQDLLSNFLETKVNRNPKYTPLKVPRRPKWNAKMTTHEINTQEQMSFLEWRREIAMLVENNVSLAITPFEKNLEVWKQLWRVVEKCDLLLQIVDARNPFFYYSSDLEKYIKEMGDNKQYILLINKADYLTEELRQHWSDYFNEQGVAHIFFSALDSQAVIDNDDEEELQTTKISSANLFNRADLLGFLQNAVEQYNKKDDRLNIGMVGYPNVGKSSVINVLCGRKRVGVAAMPGKTKHFQTLNIEGGICLCDCPGLVFPSFTNSKAEMMLCGVLPID